MTFHVLSVFSNFDMSFFVAGTIFGDVGGYLVHCSAVSYFVVPSSTL